MPALLANDEFIAACGDSTVAAQRLAACKVTAGRQCIEAAVQAGASAGAKDGLHPLICKGGFLQVAALQNTPVLAVGDVDLVIDCRLHRRAAVLEVALQKLELR